MAAQCKNCGTTLGAASPAQVCPTCGQPVEIQAIGGQAAGARRVGGLPAGCLIAGVVAFVLLGTLVIGGAVGYLYLVVPAADTPDAEPTRSKTRPESASPHPSAGSGVAPGHGLPTDSGSASARPCARLKRRFQKLAVDDADAGPRATASAYGAVLDRGHYLQPCHPPDSVRIEICAAVQNGKALGVEVFTRPHDPALARCVGEQVGRLSFPAHPALDISHTVFEATE